MIIKIAYLDRLSGAWLTARRWHDSMTLRGVRVVSSSKPTALQAWARSSLGESDTQSVSEWMGCDGSHKDGSDSNCCTAWRRSSISRACSSSQSEQSGETVEAFLWCMRWLRWWLWRWRFSFLLDLPEFMRLSSRSALCTDECDFMLIHLQLGWESKTWKNIENFTVRCKTDFSGEICLDDNKHMYNKFYSF